MECTTFETMCEGCQYDYMMLEDQGEAGDVLEYEPATYPIVFKSMWASGNNSTFALEEDYARRLLTNVQYRLHERFRKPVSVACNYEMFQQPKGLFVCASLLIDFPCEALPVDMKSFLRGVLGSKQGFTDWTTKVEMDDDLKEYILEGEGAGIENWDAYIASNQDDLCSARLRWFTDRAKGVCKWRILFTT